MTVLKQTQYLNFTLLPSNGKTKLVGVGNNSGEKLGYIKWSTGWRRYVFLTISEIQFDVTCLMDICLFINELMEERKSS